MNETAHDTTLYGGGLTLDEVVRLGGTDRPRIEVTDAAFDRVTRSWDLAERLAQTQPVYGRTTGVGANRTADVDGGLGHTLRLLRSHATGTGPLLPVGTVRRAMIVRLEQLLRGGSGMHPGIVVALRDALRENRIPAVHAVGPIGTGDLSGLAEIGLALMGELPFADGTTARLWTPKPGDALPLISSNAVTLADACGVLADVERWIARHTTVAALSFAAVRASRQPLAPAVHAARPLPGQGEAAAELLDALGGPVEPARIQDSFGFRVHPQVTGPLVEAAARLRTLLGTEIVAAAENPLVDLDGERVLHNGNFHAMALALAVDHAKLALAAVSQLSMSRVADLSSPVTTGLTPFLSDGTPGSSGAMLLEYVQAAAQAELRHAAAPATLGSVVVSRGTENHAAFATQAVDQLRRCLAAATDVLACELLCALRVFDLRGEDPATLSPRVGRDLADLLPRLDHDLADRPLTSDLDEVRNFLQSDPS